MHSRIALCTQIICKEERLGCRFLSPCYSELYNSTSILLLEHYGSTQNSCSYVKSKLLFFMWNVIKTITKSANSAA